MFLLQKSRNKQSSRRQIAIKEIRDGILTLPGNQYRLVLETSSVNIELKSEDEQNVLIDTFQNFLNSLPGPFQILIRIRELDINDYLEKVTKEKDIEKEQIYKQQLDNYAHFIKDLVSGNKILSRRFYVIIPYHHTDSNQDFNLIKEQLYLKRDIITRGLEKLGMKVKILDSLGLLNLFYSFYNAKQSKVQPLKTEVIEVKGEYYA